VGAQIHIFLTSAVAEESTTPKNAGRDRRKPGIAYESKEINGVGK
jgi:hypothetical protein